MAKNKVHNYNENKEIFVIGAIAALIIFVIILYSSKQNLVKEVEILEYPKSCLSEKCGNTIYKNSEVLIYTNSIADSGYYMDTAVNESINIGDFSYSLDTGMNFYSELLDTNVEIEGTFSNIAPLIMGKEISSLREAYNINGYANGYSANYVVYEINNSIQNIEWSFIIYELKFSDIGKKLTLMFAVKEPNMNKLSYASSFLTSVIYTIRNDTLTDEERKHINETIESNNKNYSYNADLVNNAYEGEVIIPQVIEPSEEELQDELLSDIASEDRVNEDDYYKFTDYLNIEDDYNPLYIEIQHNGIDVPCKFSLQTPDERQILEPVFVGINEAEQCISVFFKVIDAAKGAYKLTISDTRIGPYHYETYSDDQRITNYQGHAFTYEDALKNKQNSMNNDDNIISIELKDIDR